LGSLPTGSPAGIWDVNGLKMLVSNAARGADYFIPASGNSPTKITTSTNGKDIIGQFGPLLIHLNAAGNAPFYFFTPPDAKIEQKNGIWFLQFDKTWLALHPLNLNWMGENAAATVEVRKRAPGVTINSAQGTSNKFCGYILEAGEAPKFARYEQFRDAILQKAKVDVSQLNEGIVSYRGANAHTIKVQNIRGALPQIWRDGALHEWQNHLAPYQGAGGKSPVTQGWKSGAFRVEAGGKTFEAKLSPNGKYLFTAS
jgi:hypothetical protein